MTVGWMRNYKAMGTDKLAKCLQELEGQYGDAYHRMMNQGGLLSEHLREARQVALSKGLNVGNVIPADAPGSLPLTEAMECSECGRVERYYVDDYICRKCRDAS